MHNIDFSKEPNKVIDDVIRDIYCLKVYTKRIIFNTRLPGGPFAKIGFSNEVFSIAGIYGDYQLAHIGGFKCFTLVEIGIIFILFYKNFAPSKLNLIKFLPECLYT